MPKPRQHLKMVFEDKENGQVVCACGCGYVLDSKTVDRSYAPIESDHDSKMSRPVSPITSHDRNLTTKISKIKGNPDFNRLANLQDRVRISNNRERRVGHTLETIKLIGEKLHMSKVVIEEACYFARKIQTPHTNGFTIKTISCILLLLASKRSFHPESAIAFKPYLPANRRFTFLSKVLEVKTMLGLNYDVKSKHNPKKEPTLRINKNPSLTCEYCLEPTQMKRPIILEDGTEHICCNYCTQILRINGIKYDRIGNRTDAEIEQVTGIGMPKKYLNELKSAKKQYETDNNTEISIGEFVYQILQFYLKAKAEAKP